MRTAPLLLLLSLAVGLGAFFAIRGVGGETSDVPATDPESSFERCPSPESYFCRPLPDDAPIDPRSDELSRELRNQAYGVPPGTQVDCARANLIDDPAALTAVERVGCVRVTSRAAIAYDDFAPMLYTVGPDQPRVPVVLDTPSPALAAALGSGVPIPSQGAPAPGSDSQLIVYQPSTDTMWELWRAYRDPEGTWHASWGGRMNAVSENPGHYTTVPAEAAAGEPAFAQQHQWGGPASSIPNLPGIVTVEQLRSGEIGHALVFSTWANDPNEWVYPAQRTDGRCRGEDGQYCSQIPQGARFRIDPDFDTSTIDHPIARMFAQAAQDYGMVLNNSTGGGLGFYVEGWRGHPDWGDPYYGEEGLFRSDPDQLSSALFMREFPWEAVEMIRAGTTCTDPAHECPPPEDWSNGTFDARGQSAG